MGIKGRSKYQNSIKIGQKFHKWTVISDVVVNKEAMVNCKCECGTEKVLTAYSLVTGASKGCLKCSFQAKEGIGNPFWRGEGEIPGTRLKKKTKEERIVLSDAWEKSNGKCALTGWDISFKDRTASPDRIDSSKGYVEGNVQWVHKDANVCKNLFDMDYFLTLCHAIVLKHNINPNKNSPDLTFGK